MKKSVGNLFLLITVSLCLFLMPGISGIKSHAATGDLYEGSKFNESIKSFNNEAAKHNTVDNTVKRIIFAKELPSGKTNLPKKTVGSGVTAYYDASDNTVYVCSKSKMKFNSICNSMFQDFEGVETIDFGKDLIDTSAMTNASYMFRSCDHLKELDLREFRTPKLKIMCQMFHNCTSMKSINLSSFDTSNVTDMQTVFDGCCSLENLDLSNFNTAKVTLMLQMFERTHSLKTLDLGNFDTRNVKNMYRMFDNARSLETLNISSFKTPKLENVQEMFYGCEKLKYLDLSGFDFSNVKDEQSGGFLGMCYGLINIDAPGKLPKNFDYSADTQYVRNCSIGKCAIDDDKNGQADSSDTYSSFIKADKSHRYIFTDNIQRAEDALYHNVDFYYVYYGGHGKAIASPEKAKAGTVVTLTAIPDEHCRFHAWVVKSGDVTIKDNKFVMGDKDVKIQVHFEYLNIFACNVSAGTGGGHYYEGDSVKIKANAPEEGMRFKEWKCNEDLKFTGGSKTSSEAVFIMPGEYVELTATYEPIPGYSGSDGKVNPDGETAGGNDSGYKKGTDASDVENSGYKKGTDALDDTAQGKDSGSAKKDKSKTTEKIDKKLKNTAIKNAKAGKKSVTVTWDKKTAGRVKGYEIQYSTDKKFKKNKTNTVTINKVKTEKLNIKKLKSKKKYYLRIRTFTKKSGVKVYSKWSKTVTVKVK